MKLLMMGRNCKGWKSKSEHFKEKTKTFKGVLKNTKEKLGSCWHGPLLCHLNCQLPAATLFFLFFEIICPWETCCSFCSMRIICICSTNETVIKTWLWWALWLKVSDLISLACCFITPHSYKTPHSSLMRRVRCVYSLNFIWSFLIGQRM